MASLCNNMTRSPFVRLGPQRASHGRRVCAGALRSLCPTAQLVPSTPWPLLSDDEDVPRRADGDAAYFNGACRIVTAYSIATVRHGRRAPLHFPPYSAGPDSTGPVASLGKVLT